MPRFEMKHPLKDVYKRQVINVEKGTGVTTMQMDEGLDTGDMLLKEEVILDEEETGGSLHDKLAEAGARLCVRTLKALEDGSACLLYTSFRPFRPPGSEAGMSARLPGNHWNTKTYPLPGFQPK